jgi:hypothetical protein
LPEREFLNLRVLFEDGVGAGPDFGGSTDADIDSSGFLHGKISATRRNRRHKLDNKRPSADKKRFSNRTAAEPTPEGRGTTDPVRFVEDLAVFSNCFSRGATLDAWDYDGR